MSQYIYKKPRHLFIKKLNIYYLKNKYLKVKYLLNNSPLKWNKIKWNKPDVHQVPNNIEVPEVC